MFITNMDQITSTFMYKTNIISKYDSGYIIYNKWFMSEIDACYTGRQFDDVAIIHTYTHTHTHTHIHTRNHEGIVFSL